jgi:hypothetical protein
VLGATVSLGLAPAQPPRGASVAETQVVAGLPIWFEPNTGQGPAGVHFVSRARGYTLGLEATGMTLTLAPSRSQPDTLLVRLVGGDPDADVVIANALPGRSHYFVGNDPRRWRTNIAQYGRVEYRNVYRGIDLVYRAEHGRLEYDFVVRPGADPRRIRLRIEGADAIVIRPDGALALATNGGTVVQQAPVVYQESSRGRRSIDGRWIRRGRQDVAFEIGSYDKDRTLVIDPVLSFSSYLGAGGRDESAGLALDAAGNAHLVFSTATETPNSTVNVFKIRPDGSLVYSATIGGSAADIAAAIAVDASGAAYVTGVTSSVDFPVVNAAQPTKGVSSFNSSDAFVTKLNPAGSAVLYSTFLGGNNAETAYGIAVDGAGAAYLTGSTLSSDFPLVAPLQGWGGVFQTDAFVTKVAPDGSRFVYSTYLGGSGLLKDDLGYAIAVDANGAAYVTGATNADNFPVVNALQPTPGFDSAALAACGSFGGDPNKCVDAFLAKLNPGGTSVAFATYLGGTYEDRGKAIALEPAGAIAIAGFTSSPNFPVVNALFGTIASPPPCPLCRGVPDGFVTRISLDGQSILYSTYLGGNGSDMATAIGRDAAGNLYVAGQTQSGNFPTAAPVQPTLQGAQDAFVARLGATGQPLVFSTFLGGTTSDDAKTLAVDALGSVWVTGTTFSADFPTLNPLKASLGGGADAYVSRLVNTDLWAADASARRPRLGTATATVRVSLPAALTQQVTVDYATADDSALAGAEYLAVSGTLTFPPGTTSQLVNVTVNAAPLGAPKRFFVNLVNPTNATLGKAKAAVTILDLVPSSDLDGDGRGDILWRAVGGPATGALYVWLMNGTAIKSSTYLDPISTAWAIQGLGDFNGDGKGDILWREAASGGTYIWMMNGSTVIAGTGFTNHQADNLWRIVGIGDLNGDGKSDILWRNVGGPDYGAMYVWLMDGTTRTGTYLDPISTDWEVQRLGDFNGDGKADVLWRENGTGRTYIWMMDGPVVVAGTGYTNHQADERWRVEGVGDLNGDGRSDILWRNVGGPDYGAMFVWLMDGTNRTGTYLDPISTDWQVLGLADFNGDGKSDILWRSISQSGSDAGKLFVWMMDGATVTAGTGYTNSQADFTWEVKSPR